jgi:putative transposase
MPHTFSNILVHIVFSTKYRKKALRGEIRAKVLAVIESTARREKCNPIAVNGVSDHVHLLLRIRPSHCISDIMRKIKANSSKWIHENHSTLKTFKWQTGFSAFSIGESAAKRITEHIEDQENHHGEKHFTEELKHYCRENRIEFEEEMISETN